jgi:hypothetical protein
VEDLQKLEMTEKERTPDLELLGVQKPEPQPGGLGEIDAFLQEGFRKKMEPPAQKFPKFRSKPSPYEILGL